MTARAVAAGAYVKTSTIKVNGVDTGIEFAFVLDPAGFKWAVLQSFPQYGFPHPETVRSGDDPLRTYTKHTVFRCLDDERMSALFQALGLSVSRVDVAPTYKQTFFAAGTNLHGVELTCNTGRTQPYDHGGADFRSRAYNSMALRVADLETAAAAAAAFAHKFGLVIGKRDAATSADGAVLYDFVDVVDPLE